MRNNILATKTLKVKILEIFTRIIEVLWENLGIFPNFCFGQKFIKLHTLNSIKLVPPNETKMQEEIYTKEEHYQDWKSDNLSSLKEDFLAEYLELHFDDFEAYCKQRFRDRD